MPRNVGTNIYSIPPGTEGFPDTTIESEKYNNYIHDVETDLNTPRPINAGGTGANDAEEALFNLGAEKSSQQVTNYDTHVWLPGSFYSQASASGSPVAGHAFVGWVVSSDAPATPAVNQNVVVHARDQNGTTVPGRIYVREKKAGVWGPWAIDGSGIAGDTPPLSPPDGALWWDNESGQLYVYYNDGNSKQWVIASPVPDPAQFLLKAGDTMIGTLGLAAPPVAALDAVNKQYVDGGVAGIPGKVSKAGDVMTGLLTLSGAPTVDMHAATKLYVDTTVDTTVDATINARFQRFSLAGVQSIDIPVPAGIGAVRVTCMIMMGGGAMLNLAIQASFSPGVFLETTGQYILNGFYHDNQSNPTQVSAFVSTSYHGFTLCGAHNNTQLPIIAEGSILLKRPDTTKLFSSFITATASVGGTQMGHFWTYVPSSGSGSALKILALRVMSAGAHENFADDSFINMEWI